MEFLAFMKKAYLVLADGTVYEGQSFGAEAECTGELVFRTGVTGYLETLSDPAYTSQIVLETFAQIGNYGVIGSDLSGKCRLAGYAVREWCASPSNFRCEGDLDAFLKKEGIPGICGIDTRAVTRHLRENGTMNAMITASVPGNLNALRAFVPADPLLSAARAERNVLPAKGEEKFRVSAIDYGSPDSLFTPLTECGCSVAVFPPSADAQTILAESPDAILLSGGPGNPADYPRETAKIAALAGKVPLFAVGLGHQMLALALGARTEKMRTGHRGGNQPVRDTAGSRTYITAQNHGYTVCPDSVTAGTVRYVNANDGSCEGIDYPALHAFSVQFDPAASQDGMLLYRRFIDMMGGEDGCRAI